MTEYTSVPRNYGFILVMAGIITFVPMLAFLLDQFAPNDDNGWSIIMFVFTVLGLSMSVVLMIVGTNIAWYHDPKDDERTHEEIAEKSKFYPKESDDGKKD